MDIDEAKRSIAVNTPLLHGNLHVHYSLLICTDIHFNQLDLGTGLMAFIRGRARSGRRQADLSGLIEEQSTGDSSGTHHIWGKSINRISSATDWHIAVLLAS